MDWCPLARFLLVLVGVLALAWPLRAAADEAAPDLLPRDVSVVVQPEAAKLPPLPSDFQRIEHGWITVELPSSVRDRGDALLRQADDFRVRLSEDFGQPALGDLLVRIARTPEQMAELAPESAPPLPTPQASPIRPFTSCCWRSRRHKRGTRPIPRSSCNTS